MKRLLGVWLLVVVMGCGHDNKDNSSAIASPVTYDYTTTTRQVASQNISAAAGGIIGVTDETSAIAGVILAIPPGALSNDTNITVGEVNNPPAPPIGLNYVGVPIDFGPSGTVFTTPAIVEIPFSETAMDDAGVSSKTALKLYYFDKTAKGWTEAKIISINTVRNVVIGRLDHFSYYAIFGLNGIQPHDIGTPQPGDLLYKLTLEDLLSGWRPGHVGVYTGEKVWNGLGAASADVKRCNKYNVVEVLADGTQYSYYNIPNTVETCSVSTGFEWDSIYMGAREPKDVLLTQQQRERIVSYAEAQVGKPYAWKQMYGAAFGLSAGRFVKGPDSFNCVGLAEKAYEVAGVNGG